MKFVRGWRTIGLALCGALTVAAGCSKDTDGFSPEEWDRVKAIEPLGSDMPANRYDNRASEDAVAKLGQKLFYEKELAEAITASGPAGNMGDLGKVGCVTCHDSKYFADSRPFPQSHGRTWLTHNTPAMVNLGWFQWTLWTGTFDSLMAHGAGAWGTSATPLAQAHYLYKKYRDEYNAVFPDSPLDPALDPMAVDAKRFPATGSAKANAAAADGAFEKMAFEDQWKIHEMRANLGKVFEAYPRKLITPNSRFARYIHGERSEEVFSSRAKNGLKLFIGKASCIDCHNGPLLSDNQFHNIGVPGLTIFPPATTTMATPDRGRAGSLAGLLNNALTTLRTNAQIRANAIAAGDTLIEGRMAKTEVPIFTGAGQYSDDNEAGLARLVKLENELCPASERKPDAVPTTCGNLFKAPNMMATPPDPGDPRYQVCLDVNMPVGICASLDEKGAIVSKFDSSLEGSFRTPSLLNIAETGPYFHTGMVATLRDVIWHYNQGGGVPGSFVGTKSPRMRPLLLTDAEVDDLVEFLKTLTGDAPDPSWACNPLLGPPAGCGPPGAGATGGSTGAGGAGGAGRGGSTGTAGSGAGGNTGSAGRSGMGGASAAGGASATGGIPGTGGNDETSGGSAGGAGGAGGN